MGVFACGDSVFVVIVAERLDISHFCCEAIAFEILPYGWADVPRCSTCQVCGGDVGYCASGESRGGQWSVAPSVDRGQERPLISRIDTRIVAGEFVTVTGVHAGREHVGAEIPVRKSENFHPPPIHLGRGGPGCCELAGSPLVDGRSCRCVGHLRLDRR